MNQEIKKRFLVAITGASGAIYGVRTIRALKQLGYEVHLIVTEWGKKTLEYETGIETKNLETEVDKAYHELDLTASPASGSYPFDGMVVIPCSMKTLASIANGIATNLVARAADCMLKERRKLILVLRETPFNLIHIRNMELVTKAGGIILPANPPFWHKPKTIEELVDSIVSRVLLHLGVTPKDPIVWQSEND